MHINKKMIALLVGSLMASNMAHAQYYGSNSRSNNTSTIDKVASSVHQSLKDEELTLEDILSKNIQRVTKDKKITAEKTLRLSKIKQIAFEYGTNVGRAERARYNEKMAELEAAKLDAAYDFSRLLIHQNPAVLPPVVSRGLNNFNLLDEKTMQVSAAMMKIEVPAQIVSVVPTWRDYLKISHKVTKHPSKSFQPADKIEREVWDEAVREGYEHGKKAADIDWEDAVGELRRDYQGMLNYKIALANGSIDPAIVEISDLKNVVDEDGTVLRQNEIMVKIARDAFFNKKKEDLNRKRNPNPSYTKLPNGLRSR